MDANDPNKDAWRVDPPAGGDDTNPTQPVQPYMEPPTGSTQPVVPDTFRAPDAQPTAPQYQPPAPYPTGPYAAQPPPPTTPGGQVNISPKKRSNTLLISGLIVVALLVVGGVAAYFVIKSTIGRSAAVAQSVLPANALGYFTVSANPPANQKATLDKMKDAFQSQPGFKEAMSKLSEQASSLGAAVGVATPAATPEVNDFDTLASYLGSNLTVAVLPPNSADLRKIQDASGSEAANTAIGALLANNVVGLVDLDFNPLDKKGPLPDFKHAIDGTGAQAEKVEVYRDTQISKYVTGTTTVYFALLDGTSTAAVGAKAEPLHTIIDQQKDKKGLQEDANFKALSGQVPQDRLATLYVNLSEVYKQVRIVAPDAGISMQRVDGAVLMTVSGQNDGLQIDVASQSNVVASGAAGAGVQINPNARPDPSVVSDVPADALGFLAGTDLKSILISTLDQLHKEKSSDSDQDMGTQIEKQFTDATGLDLRNDIFPWMGGDFMLSGSGQSTGDSTNGYALFQLKLSAADRAKAVSSLDQAMAKSTSSTETFQAAGGTFYASTSDGMVVGVAKDRLLFVFDSNPDAAKGRVDTVQSSLGKGYGATDQWQQAAKYLPKESNVLVYLDLAGIRNLAEKSVTGDSKQEYESSVAPFVRPFKYLVIGSATQPTQAGELSRNHTQIFLGISK